MRELSKLFSYFFHRSLGRCNFSARGNSVSHKLISNWRDLAVAKSEEIRKLLNEKKFGVVLSVEETFFSHHERRGSGGVLVPKGTKRPPNE